MVPNGWEQKPLKELLEKIIDYRGQSVPKSETGVPLITARNVRFGYLDFSSQEYVDESQFEAWMSRGIPSPGDILFTTEAPLGMACKYPDEGKYAVAQRTVTLRTNSHLDSEYLLYYLLSERGQRLIDIRSSGSTAKGIKSAELKKVNVLYPTSLPEQQKIANILTTWDKAIDTTERLIDNSKQQKKALMQQLLTGKKRLLDENGKRFEGEWEEVQLADLGSTFNGLTGKTKVDFGYGEKYIPYMNIFKNTFIDSNELDFVNIQANEKQSTVQFGDIFFTTSSETPEEVGMSSVFISDTQENIYLNSFCFGFRLQSLEIVSPHFIGYILRSSKIRRKISVLAQGSTRFNISKRQLVKTAIPLPSLKEQQKIAAVLTTADKEIELLEQQLADLQQEKKALMQVLLTGKKRVVVDGED